MGLGLSLSSQQEFTTRKGLWGQTVVPWAPPDLTLTFIRKKEWSRAGVMNRIGQKLNGVQKRCHIWSGSGGDINVSGESHHLLSHLQINRGSGKMPSLRVKKWWNADLKRKWSPREADSVSERLERVHTPQTQGWIMVLWEAHCQTPNHND